MALRVRSRSCALSARFLPPSIPADVTANARYVRRVSSLQKTIDKFIYLEFFVDTFQAIDSGIQTASFVVSDF